MQRYHITGFSLVELSIVLVILGLLTGGILAGQSLIRGAELRSIHADFSKYTSAVHAFRDKYRAWPGDMSNATAFWGAVNTGGAGGNCTDPAANTGTGTQTCNGNGNGFLSSTGSGSDSATTYERFRFWQHLANAGLAEGTYTGVSPTGGTTSVVLPGTNAPLSRLANTGFMAGYSVVGASTSTDSIVLMAGHHFTLGKTRVNSTATDPFLTPEEAWNVDVKTDDGLPAQGRMIAKFWGTCTLATSATDTSAAYDLTKKTQECSLKYYSL